MNHKIVTWLLVCFYGFFASGCTDKLSSKVSSNNGTQRIQSAERKLVGKETSKNPSEKSFVTHSDDPSGNSSENSLETRITAVQIFSAGRHKKGDVKVEVVSKPGELEKGLMFRKSMPEDSGMLFIMPQKKILSFWMKNTYIPLSIAFIDDGMKIVDIHKMRPLDEDTHYLSSKPCRYALEVNQGWFKSHGIRPHDKVQFVQQ